MTNRAVLYERTLQKYDPTPRKPLTPAAAMEAAGFCAGCLDNHQMPGSRFCARCESEAAHAEALIAAVHRESDPAVREVKVRSLRDIFSIVLRRAP